MKHIVELTADTELEVTLSGEMNYLNVSQPKGSEPVYMDMVTGVTVGAARAIVIPAKSLKQTPYQFDRVESLFLICAEDTTVVIQELEAFTSPIRKTAADSVVTDFDFGSEARTFEITNFGPGDIYFAVNRDPDSAEEYTRKVVAESGYYPTYDTPAKCIRVYSDGANEVEVVGYPKDDPVNRRAKKY